MPATHTPVKRNAIRQIAELQFACHVLASNGLDGFEDDLGIDAQELDIATEAAYAICGSDAADEPFDKEVETILHAATVLSKKLARAWRRVSKDI